MELKNKKMLNKLTSTFLVIAMIFSLVIMPSISVKAEAKTETKTEYDCPVMLMIDTSGSMQDQNKIVSTKEEAKKLFDTFKNIEVGLATFNSNGEKRIISSLTKDYEALKKQIDDLKVVGDKNKLERPLGEAIEMAKEHVASMKKYDKVVVKVMTDVTDKDGVPTSITKNATHHDDYTFMLNQPNQSIVLVIDASGSMDRFGYVNGKQLPTKKMENAKKAASGFIDAIKDKNIELGLVYFASNGVERTIPLTKDLDSIKRKINAINAGGGTPLGAAITQAGKELTDNAKTSQGRIIVFGDGESDDNAVEAATNLGKITENSKGGSLSIIVDTIGINVNENTRKQLAEIAAKGNGGYHDATDDLGEIAEGLGNNLDIIGVKITTPTTNIEPGKTLQLKVEGTKKKGDKVDITNSSNGTAYTVSDEKNVSVSKDGLVSIPANAKEDIEFTVRAKNNGHEDVFKGIISKSAKNIVKSIDVIPASLTLKPGETQQLKVMATMGDDSKKDITNTINGTKYTIPVENMAQIDENGLLTIPKNAEEGTINILIENQGIKQNLNLIVEKDHSNEMKSIEVTPNQAKVKTGQSQQLKVEATMGDNSKKDITSGAGTIYKSSDEAMATVDDKGLVTVASNAKIGVVQITVTNGAFSSIAQITIESYDPNKIMKISVTPDTQNLKLGQTQKLKVVALMGDGREVDITEEKETKYKSSNENMATIDEKGLLKVLENSRIGNVSIEVIRGTLSAYCVITTQADDSNEIKSIKVEPNNQKIKLGQTQQLKVLALMGDGREVDITKEEGTKYKSTNENMVTIDEKGLLKVLENSKIGNVAIEIVRGTYSAVCVITTEADDSNEIKSIRVIPNNGKMKLGQTQQLQVLATLGDGKEVDITNEEGIVYKTSNESLATVTNKGLVAVQNNAKVGNVVIEVIKEKKSASCLITVEEDLSNKVSKIKVTPDNAKIKAGQTQQLSVIAIMGDGKEVDITQEAQTLYKSTNERMAIVSDKGLITIPADSKSGNVTIVVTKGTESKSILITVEEDDSNQIKSIKVLPNQQKVKLGQTQQLQVFAVMGDGREVNITEEEGITYKSNNESMATVTNKGLVAVQSNAKIGNVAIEVIKGRQSALCLLTIQPDDANEVKSIKIVPNNQKIKLGKTQQLQVLALMGDGREEDITEADGVTYKSSNEQMATVTNKGLVTVQGNAKIGNVAIEVVKGKQSALCVITTQPDDSNEIKSIRVIPNNQKIKLGKTQQLQVLALMGDGREEDITETDGVTYKSSNETIATVTNKGLVEVKDNAKIGNVAIEVVKGKQSTLCLITTEVDLSNKILKIKVTPDTAKIKAGQKQQLSVIATMGDGKDVDITGEDGTVYKSSNESMATVSNKGLITIPANSRLGNVVITVVRGSETKNVLIQVQEDDSNQIKSIKVLPNQQKIKLGQTQQLQVFAVMGDGREEDITEADGVTYKSSNESMATVTNKGLVTVQGNAKIGNVAIEVMKGRQSGICVITTQAADSNQILSIKCVPDNLNVKVGQTQQLKVFAVMGDGREDDITSEDGLIFKSTNESMATVNNKGLVTVKNNAKIGNVAIEVVKGRQSAVCLITTQPDDSNQIKSIRVIPNKDNLKLGQTQQLQVLALMGDGREEDITEESGTMYKSSNENMATVTSKGLVTVAGNAKIGNVAIEIIRDKKSAIYLVTTQP